MALSAAAAVWAAADAVFRALVDTTRHHRPVRTEGVHGHHYDGHHYDDDHYDDDLIWFRQTQRQISISGRSAQSISGHPGHPVQRLRGLVLDPDRGNPPGHRYAICCHSRTGSPESMASPARRFARMGCRVLVPFGRGSGQGQSRYLGMGLLEGHDLHDWIREILAHDPQAEILLYGVSMGAVAVIIAGGAADLPDNVVGVVAECPYANAYDQLLFTLRRQVRLPRGTAHLLAVSANLLCRHRAGYDLRDADCIRALRHARIPMMFIAAGSDQVVDHADFERLWAACASKVRDRLVIARAGHAVCASTDPVTYWTAVKAFVGNIWPDVSGNAG